MTKSESIARRILGWKLNRWDRWYDHEQNKFIQTNNFQPEKEIDHAMLIVNRLKKYGFSYTTNGATEVCFNDVRATGETLPQAITNAAYNIVEIHGAPEDSSKIWQKVLY